MFQWKLSTNVKKYKNNLFGMEKTQKLKTPPYVKKCKNGGLKNVDILSKVINLQCSWVKRLYDNSSPPWKIMPSYLIDIPANFGIPANIIKRFLICYKQIFKCITVDDKTIYNFKMSRKDINYVRQLFKSNGKPKLWEELKNEFNLQGQLQFIYNQIMHSIPKSWKDAPIAKLENIKNLVF